MKETKWKDEKDEVSTRQAMNKKNSTPLTKYTVGPAARASFTMTIRKLWLLGHQMLYLIGDGVSLNHTAFKLKSQIAVLLWRFSRLVHCGQAGRSRIHRKGGKCTSQAVLGLLRFRRWTETETCGTWTNKPLPSRQDTNKHSQLLGPNSTFKYKIYSHVSPLDTRERKERARMHFSVKTKPVCHCLWKQF